LDWDESRNRTEGKKKGKKLLKKEKKSSEIKTKKKTGREGDRDWPGDPCRCNPEKKTQKIATKKAGEGRASVDASIAKQSPHKKNQHRPLRG